MKNSNTRLICRCRKSACAFTLVEVMVAVAVFTLLFTAMIATQLFAFRIYTLAANRGSMTTDSRQTMDQIRDTVREAQTLYVGNCSPGNATSFVAATNTQSGNALKVFSTTNTTPYVIYYLDTSTATNYLKSYTVSAGNVATTNTLAGYITNTVIFYAEDYRGNVLTDNNDNRVIDVVLQFNQYAFASGAGTVNSAYQLRTRTTQRTLNPASD